MISDRIRRKQRLLAGSVAALFGLMVSSAMPGATNPANRLTHLDANDPFYVDSHHPRLITPQWVGEAGVEAVIILATDDLNQPEKHEAFLRPILERLKVIDGRAPVSLMATEIDPAHSQFQGWRQEGLSLEVHTLTHRHPLLSQGDFAAGAHDYHGSVDLMHRLPGNYPVAARLPYCDSMNVASPRFYAEIFNRVSAQGKFLSIDSSVGHVFSSKDASLPREAVLDAEGRERFLKYLPAETNSTTRVSMKDYATYIENYPYPYVVGRLCWEFPIMLPSDWQAHNTHGSTNPLTLADWQAALDAVVHKQGTMTMCFHPHGWIQSAQMVNFIDYAVARHGAKVKFLTFREALERLNQHLLSGQPLRNDRGQDNGARLLDVNNDGYLDVAIGNAQIRKTRIWEPRSRSWRDSGFPTEMSGVQFGIVRPDGYASLIQLEPSSNRPAVGAHFDGQTWIEDPSLTQGLALDGQPLATVAHGRDRGARWRDLDRDGQGELIVGNETQNAIFRWSAEEKKWKALNYTLPHGTTIVDAEGRDAGLRFVDFNEDGYDDVYFSSPDFYRLRLFVSEAVPNLGWMIGWNDEIVSGQRGQKVETTRTSRALPLVVREGPHRNNGAWFHSNRLFVQNEDTDALPGQVDQRSFDQLLRADQPPPMTPEETLATIRVLPGFKVELVAKEPLTMDPVAFDWGEDGKFWVAEMGDYPLGMDGQGKPGGVVRYLEDTDGDGVYDQSTVFLEGVNFPNGVMPWRKGVLVSAAPEIFYAEDTDGDGRADVRRSLFAGFTEGNQQHRINGFEYGLDNWIHAANGDSGGQVLSVLTGKKTNIRGRDVRFRPDDGAFETTAGQTQYGRHRDDWGNWFGNNNINWLWHYYLPEHYLVRNPHLAVKTMKHLLAQYPDAPRLYPTSPFLQRPNWPDQVNLVTSASAAIPYRDDLFGPDFSTSVLICEPVYQAIHREVLSPDGVTFTSHRAASEPGIEFFTSSDNWCRPVFTRVGPDGALYIADMYRFVIEHPEWIPERMQKRLDLRAGDTLGRIYRVYPENATLRPIPRLDGLSATELVAALNHPGGWQRDTVQRLLAHRADAAAVPALSRLAKSSSDPRARLHALCALEGLDALNSEVIATALQDEHAAVRQHAVRLSESLLRELGPAPRVHLVQSGDTWVKIANQHGMTLNALRAANPSAPGNRLRAGQKLNVVHWTEWLLALVDDQEMRIRYQLAFTLGEWNDPLAGQALTRLARRDFENPAMQIAIMSSAIPHLGAMLSRVFAPADEPPPPALLEQLFALAAALNNEPALANALQRLVPSGSEAFDAWQFATTGSLLDALDRRNLSVEKFRTQSGPILQTALDRLPALFAAARQLVSLETNLPSASPKLLSAIRLLGRGVDQRSEDLQRLTEFLRPQVPPAVQSAALDALGRSGNAQVSEILLAGWRSYGPGLRPQALDVLFSRKEWLQALLAAIEHEDIYPAQIDPAHQQTLLSHAQTAVRHRAMKLFASPNSDRQQLVKDYLDVAGLKGDPARGAELFQLNCATCHQLKGQGASIGADLGTVADRPLEYLLESIIHPNKAVEARYISYTVVTLSENEFSGIITEETPTSITLRNAAAEDTFLRTDIDTLSSSSLSLMPEGLEAALPLQEMANLIEFLKSGNEAAK